MAVHVTSADNPRFRRLLKLHQSSRERRKSGLSLLDGVHLVTAYLENVGAPDEMVVSRSRMQEPEIDRLLTSTGMPAPLVLSDALFRQLSSTATPTGVIAVVKTPARSVLPPEGRQPPLGRPPVDGTARSAVSHSGFARGGTSARSSLRAAPRRPPDR